MRTLLIVPTYNEAFNLVGIVKRVRAAQPMVDVLIVDDASPDGTGRLADDLSLSDPQVFVMHRTAKSGLGDAYIDGFRWAIDAGYELIGEMDADGSHRPEQLARLIDASANADVVIGSRWTSGGSIENWAKSREVLSRAGNLYIRVALGLPVKDATAGYRLYRAEVLRAIDLDAVASRGYCFQTDLTRRAHHAGFSIVEVPIDFVERTAGASKMSKNIVAETIANVTRWGFRDRIDRIFKFVSAGRIRNR